MSFKGNHTMKTLPRTLATIQVLPHHNQRYDTVGDYYRDEYGELIVRVSDMGNDKLVWLVAIHELIEVLICEHDGVKEKDITKFDIAFEKARKPGNTDEPGDDEKAPYRKQHLIATAVEKLLCAELGVSWKAYDDAVNAL